MNYQGYRPPSQSPQPLPPRQASGRVNRKRRRHPVLCIVLALLLLGGGAGTAYYLKVSSQVDAVQGVFLNNIYVDGIHLGGKTPQQAIDAVVEHINARQNSWSLRLAYQGHVYTTLTYSTLGVSTDLAQVYAQMEQAYQLGHTGTLIDKKRDLDALAQTPYAINTAQSSITDTHLNEILSVIQQNLTYAASDAYLVYFDPNASDPFLIQGESYGSYLDVESVKAQILEMAAAGQSGDLNLQPQTLAPAVTEKDIRAQVTLRAQAITPISKQSTAARTDNIRIAFSKISGQTIEPGEQFSFNTIVGERSLNNGFQYAIEYENGREVIGVGGGVCQASTTVYLAALMSNLEITKRDPHSDPVSYTTFGQDATVLYTRDRKIDFAFKNTSGGTLYMTARVEPATKNTYQCVVNIYGPSLGENVSYKLRTITVETIPAPLTPEYIKDTNQEYVTYTDEEPHQIRKAREGYINETYLQRWEGSAMVSESLISRDTCKARSALYYVGTKNR